MGRDFHGFGIYTALRQWGEKISYLGGLPKHGKHECFSSVVVFFHDKYCDRSCN